MWKKFYYHFWQFVIFSETQCIFLDFYILHVIESKISVPYTVPKPNSSWDINFFVKIFTDRQSNYVCKTINFDTGKFILDIHINQKSSYKE